MNVKELIADAYKDAQLVNEYGDEITTSDEQRALRQLNYVIRSLNLEKKYISYITTITTPLVPGQEEYSIALVDIDYIEFLLGGSVRTQIHIKSIADYFNRARIKTVVGIPQIGYVEPQPDYTLKLFLYMPSAYNWTMTIKGRKSINQFSINDDIAAELDPYIPFFIFSLANRLRQVEQVAVNPYLLSQEKKERSLLFDNRQLNTIVEKSTALRSGKSTWADVNLGKPWSPTP